MVLERILLQTIKFDLQVEHPYMFLLRYVKQLKGETGPVQISVHTWRGFYHCFGSHSSVLIFFFFFVVVVR